MTSKLIANPARHLSRLLMILTYPDPSGTIRVSELISTKCIRERRKSSLHITSLWTFRSVLQMLGQWVGHKQRQLSPWECCHGMSHDLLGVLILGNQDHPFRNFPHLGGHSLTPRKKTARSKGSRTLWMEVHLNTMVKWKAVRKSRSLLEIFSFYFFSTFAF